MRRRSWIVLLIVTGAVLLLGGRALTALVVNNAWYSALNAEPVFWEQLTDTVLQRGGLWLVGTLFAFANLYAVRRTIRAVAVPSRVANIEMTAMLPTQRLQTFIGMAAAVVGLLLAAPFGDWTLLAMARRGVQFGESEFYFQRDLGYYVYWLPLEESLYVWALLALVVMIAIVVVLYALTRSLRIDGRRIIASTHARRHLSVLGALVMLLLAWSYRLDGYDLLRYGSGDNGLFLRVDHVVTLKIDFMLGLLSVVASVVLLRAGWAGQTRMATATLSVVLLAALAVRHGVPALMASGSAIGDPARRELDYIATRALVTRRAYDVDGIVTVSPDASLQAGPGLQLKDLPRVLSVWDAAPLARALGQANDAREAVAPIAWSPDNGGVQGLLLERPVTGDGSWTLVRVNGSVADDRGQPVHEGADADGASDSASLNVADYVSAGSIAEPLIAPGVGGHRLVVDSVGRVVGERLESTASRVAHAWATRDPRLLSLAGDGTVPTLVMWRDVRERVRRLAPIFAQGQDIVPILDYGTLYWTLELYSASDTYPLSQRWLLAGTVRSYFHHAATALVNSRTGRVQLITVRRPDPIARTWMTLTPDLFVPVSKLATSLREQLPPPTDGAIAQIRAFTRYGSLTEGTAPRHLPDSILGSDLPPAQLLDGGSPAAGWSVPVLNIPEQIAGLATATGGAQRGTRWAAVAHPDARWGVISDRLRTALDSSRLELGDGGKREPLVTYGRIRTVLIDGAPVAMQPLYVTRLNGTQALARVAIATGSAVAVGQSTLDAVERLQGTHGEGPAGAATGAIDVPLSPASRQAALTRLYEAMRTAMHRGDWYHFGLAFDSVGVLLGRPPQ